MAISDRLGLRDDDIKRVGKLERLCRDLQDKILTKVPGRLDWHYVETDRGAEAVLAADWRQWAGFGPRTVWSRKQSHTWFAAEIEIPPEAEGRTLVLQFSSQWQENGGSTDPQCLAYLDGTIVQAIDGNHTELVVARDARAGHKVMLHVDAFTFFDRPLVGFEVAFLVRHERAEQLFYDLQTPLEVAQRLDQHDGRRHTILDLVEKSLRALDRRGGVTPEFEASFDRAEAVADRIYDLIDTEQKPSISAVGHTHLDVGWLWRVLHTREKTGRSFATALSLMDEHPEFVFMYNQAVLFDFLKTDYPELWSRLKEKVATGQFEIEGAMWVEPDVNIISGESLIRQFMRGRRFHIEAFGVTPKTVWLPDTFGYSANLPQIMARSGLEYFVTSKLSWNDTDRHPYDTFFWKGIDGSRVKAQLITTQEFESSAIYTTYNSVLSVSEVMGAWRRYEPKSANDEVLVCYGHGDGGGGPTRAMIERGKRLQRGIPGAPRVRLEGIVPYLDRLGRRMDDNAARFPVWNGELYLQYHRGTLSSVARNKANNRRAERVLRETEFLSAMAAILSPGFVYPAEKLNELWELVLINQFHDILPGTSIREVYEDSDADYETIFSTIGSQNGPWYQAARLIAEPQPDGLKLFNFTGHRREHALVRFPDAAKGAALATEQGTVPLQELLDATGAKNLGAPVRELPALGWTSVRLVDVAVPKPVSSLSVSTRHIENAHIRVAFDDAGEITSLFDKKRRRELIAPDKTANALIAYEDKPKNWDAWDIEAYFEEQGWPISDLPVTIEVVETGPYRAALRVTRSYRESRITQVISLEEGARQVEFDTHVDWRERQTVLKTLFPFDLNTSEIRSEIQFGHVTRATHRNTSWDRARFEASMHRWVDMSEPDFGAALLNDGKYAYDAVEQQVRLTLLRGPVWPDAGADLGEHHFRYALRLHAGLSDLEMVHRAAEEFNNPVAVIGRASARAGAGRVPGESFSFAEVDAGNVALETVKQAEAGDALVMRVYEHANRRATATIRFGVPVKSAALVNLMEEGGEPIAVEGNAVTLELKPFEIATLSIEAS